MQGANKTINTKVGLDLPMSEQVRQRQVTLDEGKTLVNTKGVYGSKFGNETHFLSFAAIVATKNGSEGSKAAKDRKCVSFPNLEPYIPLVLTSVFPSSSVTCLCLTCSDIGRSNPTFVFIVLLAPCMLSHITPIFNPVYKI